MTGSYRLGWPSRVKIERIRAASRLRFGLARSSSMRARRRSISAAPFAFIGERGQDQSIDPVRRAFAQKRRRGWRRKTRRTCELWRGRFRVEPPRAPGRDLQPRWQCRNCSMSARSDRNFHGPWSMVHTSKPERANTFIIEYSLPGTLRSKLDSAESEEPCTRNSTGSCFSASLPSCRATCDTCQASLSLCLYRPSSLTPNIAAGASSGLGGSRPGPNPTPNAVAMPNPD